MGQCGAMQGMCAKENATYSQNYGVIQMMNLSLALFDKDGMVDHGMNHLKDQTANGSLPRLIVNDVQ
jgi:hypothetical protein